MYYTHIDLFKRNWLTQLCRLVSLKYIKQAGSLETQAGIYAAVLK